MHEARPLTHFVPPEGFTVARALESGETPRRMRAGDLDRSYWGIRSTEPPKSLEERCRLIALRMPTEAFFSHTTAARLQGIPVPYRASLETALHVGVPTPARAPHAHGILGHRSSALAVDLIVRDGLRMTGPARTWTDLAELTPLLDLVAAGDFLIHWRSPVVARADLAREFQHRTSRRGLRAIRSALELLDERAESPPESILRSLLVLDGFAAPRINHDVTDRFGEFIARTDLLLEHENLVLEYMGDYHRTSKGQWRADMTRRSRLEAIGRRVMELNADDLRDPQELLARIRRRAAQRS